MLAKATVLFLWAFGIGSLFVDFSGVWNTVGYWTLGFLVVSHIAETLFFIKRMKKRPEPLLPNVISSLVFGIIHNRRYLEK